MFITKIRIPVFSAVLSLSIVIGWGFLYGQEKDLTPARVVAAHVKSIGSAEALARVKNRGISSSAQVQFIQGGTGNLSGQSLLVSAGSSLAVVMKYGALEYPGEYFAFDGAKTTVSNISPGQRSPLGDFLYRYNGLLKEGLLGGVWSVAWPLLDIERTNATLKYGRAKIDGRDLHELAYIVKSELNGVSVKLFFERDSFRHVRTEYSLRVRGEQALQAGRVVTRGGVTRDAGILDSVADSIYQLVETFADFTEVEGLTLPQSYSIQYSVEGQGSSFLANWSLRAAQWIHNGKIDSSMFKAH